MNIFVVAIQQITARGMGSDPVWEDPVWETPYGTPYGPRMDRRMVVVVDDGEYVLTRLGDGSIINENEFKRRWKADAPKRRDIPATVLNEVLKVVLNGSGIDYSYLSARR
jgi:hypothetical protein